MASGKKEQKNPHSHREQGGAQHGVVRQPEPGPAVRVFGALGPRHDEAPRLQATHDVSCHTLGHAQQRGELRRRKPGRRQLPPECERNGG